MQTPEKDRLLDQLLYGFAITDEDGNRVDPKRVTKEWRCGNMDPWAGGCEEAWPCGDRCGRVLVVHIGEGGTP